MILRVKQCAFVAVFAILLVIFWPPIQDAVDYGRGFWHGSQGEIMGMGSYTVANERSIFFHGWESGRECFRLQVEDQAKQAGLPLSYPPSEAYKPSFTECKSLR
jgi:hypothetical protein